jgi:hypothetical protein
MKYLIIGGLLLALLSCNSTTKNAPVMWFQYTTVPIESPTNVADTLIIEYPLINRGNRTLIVKEIIPQCGCTTAGFDKEITPLDTGFVKLQFVATKGMAGRKVRRTAHVITNAGEQELVFFITVNPIE